MLLQILLIVQLLLATAYADHQAYPGTSSRPVLSDAEAASYTKESYLQGWTPSKINTGANPDYVVGSGGYSTIQAAVNAAINDGGTNRKYIKILPGTYAEGVLIPKTSVPITILGSADDPEAVHIVLSQGAKLTGSQYANQMNPNGAVYKDGDPAWSMFNYCAQKSEIDSKLYQFATIFAFKDTLLAGGTRVYFSKPTIKGDVDFIFGSASAVFENAQIIGRGDRRDTDTVFAPNTDNSQKYGYLVLSTKITADNNVKSKLGLHLARSWDSTSTANGQVVIRETELVDVFNVDAPYDTAAGGRAYAGNANTNRNLDDANYNRFWEYSILPKIFSLIKILRNLLKSCYC
uniref:Pectinesterase n=1 Tax=Dendroctonus ponderosae TaxID=77166 RepID=A0AAR5P282_DENPD